MEKENEALKSEVGDMINELEEMRGLKKRTFRHHKQG